jgi:cob(I)alamin adenosyltransferase
VRKGLLHLYTGSGKGKTTAAVGLAIRAAGTGCPVVFAQFLKGEPSGELVSLEALGISAIRSQKRLGFTFSMDDEKKALCTSEQQLILAAVTEALEAVEKKTGEGEGSGPQALVVLDEVLDALDLGFLDEDELRVFVDALPTETELVLTGRQAPVWLTDRAAYHTEFRKLKHPYDQGILARKSIEF